MTNQLIRRRWLVLSCGCALMMLFVLITAHRDSPSTQPITSATPSVSAQIDGATATPVTVGRMERAEIKFRRMFAECGRESGREANIASKRLSAPKPAAIQLAFTKGGMPVPEIKGQEVWVIKYEDASIRDDVFIGDDAEQRARAVYALRLPNWSCHLLAPLDRCATLTDERDEFVKRLLDAEREIEAVIQKIPHPIRVREGGGHENIYASLAVSVAKLVKNYNDAIEVLKLHDKNHQSNWDSQQSCYICKRTREVLKDVNEVRAHITR